MRLQRVGLQVGLVDESQRSPRTLAEFRQDVGEWSETTWRGLSGVLKKSFSSCFRWLTASPGKLWVMELERHQYGAWPDF